MHSIALAVSSFQALLRLEIDDMCEMSTIILNSKERFIA